MTDDQLKSIRERLEAATPGPWDAEYEEWLHADGDESYAHWIQSDNDRIATLDSRHSYDDAEFIAHAPEDIAALLAEVERLNKVIDDGCCRFCGA